MSISCCVHGYMVLWEGVLRGVVLILRGPKLDEIVGTCYQTTKMAGDSLQWDLWKSIYYCYYLR